MSGLSQVLHTYGPLWGIAVTGFIIATPRDRCMSVMQLTACLLPFLACDLSRVVGIGYPSMLLLASLWFQRIPRRDAVLLSCVSAFYFLCWNHQRCYPGILEGCLIIVGVMSIKLMLTSVSGSRSAIPATRQ